MSIALFYPTGVVHYRNLEIIKRVLPGFRFRVIVESWVEADAPEVLENVLAADRVFVPDGCVSVEDWDSGFDVLFLSMAYPNVFRLDLVYEAVKRGVPVVAIEEVNQLALNDGIINHYFLPVDYFGVPSPVEKEKFVQLGLEPEGIHVTGWPFFDESAAAEKDSVVDIRERYGIDEKAPICLLVLGSLKEHDIVSLETASVRRRILEIVSRGLPEHYKLLIKPHPIETESGLAAIKQQVSGAVIVEPKVPIEPLLAQSDLVVNRGNSQVTLLAMMRKKPVIAVPVGLHTIFHDAGDAYRSIAVDTVDQFKLRFAVYESGDAIDYDSILDIHFPLTRETALQNVKELFRQAVGKQNPAPDTLLYISILYAFLGEKQKAETVLLELPEPEKYREHIAGLEALYRKTIAPETFDRLLLLFPLRVTRWHLQALYVRAIAQVRDKIVLIKSLPLLEGFDGLVNPHYFIDDILKRIEITFLADRFEKANELIDRFYDDYAIYEYYRQAFDMFRQVYTGAPGRKLRKGLWLAQNLNTPYARKYIKEKIRPKNEGR